MYYVLTGLHGLHVTAGIAAMALLFVRSARARDQHDLATWAGGVSLFWHLVDLIWVFVLLDDLAAAVNEAARSALPLAVAAAARHRDAAVARAAAPAGGARTTLGRELYETQCAACHAVDGTGVDDRGPPLTDEGRAAVDFVLRTGRMPMADPRMQARPGPIRYTEEQIVALVDYAGAFGDGPDIPDVDPARGDVANGARLYQLNCAACHVASGAGAAIGGGREAPDLVDVDADRDRPGDPRRARRDAGRSARSPTSDLDDVAAYIGQLRDQHTTATRRLRRRRPGRRGSRRVAARAAAADRPDALDRHAPRGPRRAGRAGREPEGIDA